MTRLPLELYQDFLPDLLKGAPPEVITIYKREANRVFNQYGPDAFRSSREIATVHEVGHAVVGAHEGLKIRQVILFSRPMRFGTAWEGRCDGGKPWKVNPDTSVADDLRNARFIVAGLAGEAIAGYALPGSSIDERAMTQAIAVNTASKLIGHELLNDEEHNAYAHRLWDEQIWLAAISILRANKEPFMRIAELLYQKERVKGSKLSAILAEVKKIPLPNIVDARI